MIRREQLKRLVHLLKQVEQETGERVDRYSLSEIRSISFLDERALKEKINHSSQQIRELDGLIQKQNWLTDLI